MKSVLQFLFVSNNSKDVLSKKPTKQDHMKALNVFIGQYFYLICALAIVVMLVVFMMVCFYIVGISAVESGAMRNFLARGV